MSTTDPNVIPLADEVPGGVMPPPPPRKVKVVKPKLVQQPLWPTPEESQGRAWLVGMVFLAIIGLYAWMLSSFYAGAHAGVDQAGYMMTARLIAGDKNFYAPSGPAKAAAATLPADASKMDVALAATAAQSHPLPSAIQMNPMFDAIRNRLSFVPETPYQFASRMCIMTEPYGPAKPDKPAEYRYYAKYPFGFPLLAAIGRWIWGFDGMYYVNPICTVLACYFGYFLFRQAISPFMSLIGVIWLATNPVVFNYANDANSHASTLFFVTAGFWGLLSWLRTQDLWRGCVGAFALGYACTIRYSEFLLVLPVACAALMHLRFTWRRSLESVAVMAAWAIPIGVLAGVCWVCFGAPWKTGYTYCNESTGFAWKYLTGDFGDGSPRQGNWETFVTQLNHMGLFVLWPLTLAGLFAMLGSAWRLGSIIALWVLPSAILYMLYYWAPTAENTVGYLRFFMSIVPGMIFAALWILQRALSAIQGERRSSLIAATALGAFVLIAAALFANGTTLLGVPMLFGQVGTALWHFAAESWLGLIFTLGILGLIAGIWFFDAESAAARTGMALGAGVITALGCGMNMFSMTPDIENTQMRWLGFRTTVDNLREALPKGSVVLGPQSLDEQLLNQLDAVGNWKLINTSLFNVNAYAFAKTRLDRVDKDNDGEVDPNPIQTNRLRFYIELLGRTSATGVQLPPRQADLTAARDALIDENLAAGRRVAFVVNARAKGDTVNGGDRKDLLATAQGLYTSSGYTVKPLRFWEFPTSDINSQPALTRAARLAGNNIHPNISAHLSPEIYGLYEITRAAKPPETLTKSKSATTVPAKNAINTR